MVCTLIENEIMYLSHYLGIEVVNLNISSSDIKEFVKESDTKGIDRLESFASALLKFGFDKDSFLKKEGMQLF